MSKVKVIPGAVLSFNDTLMIIGVMSWIAIMLERVIETSIQRA